MQSNPLARTGVVAVVMIAVFAVGLGVALAQGYCTGLCNEGYISDLTTGQCGSLQGGPVLFVCLNGNIGGTCSRMQTWVDGQCLTNEEPTGLNCFSGQINVILTTYDALCSTDGPIQVGTPCTCSTTESGLQQVQGNQCVSNNTNCGPT